MVALDPHPYGAGVVHPDREHPVVPDGATCQEVPFMVGNKYVRCNEPAVAVVDYGRDIYWLCAACAWHAVNNRGGTLLAGSLS